MAFQLSPGVLVTEEDRTTIVPSVATTAGAFSGAFQWGPVEEVITVDSENKLVETFGKPDDSTASYFFTAANFLSYGNNLKVVRVVDRTTARNAVSLPVGAVTGTTITDTLDDIQEVSDVVVTFTDPDNDDGVTATGNVVLASSGKIVEINMDLRGTGYTEPPTISFSGGAGSGATATATLASGTLSNVSVHSGGNNYSGSSTIVVTGGGASSAATCNLTIHYSVVDVQIDTAGNAYTVNSNVVFQDPASGTTAEGTLVLDGDGAITGITITENGSGYLTAPTITINRNETLVGGEVDGALTANIGYGTIAAVGVVTAGSGYTSEPTIIILKNTLGADPGGANAVVQPRISAIVGSISVDTAGSGFTSVPDVVITRSANDFVGVGNAQATAVLGFEIASINVINSGSGYYSAPTVSLTRSSTTVANATVTVGVDSPFIKNEESYLNSFSSGGSLYQEWAAKYPGSLGNSILVTMADKDSWAGWNPVYKTRFEGQPTTSSFVSARGGSDDELHVLVLDSLGRITGTPNTVLEKYSFLSKARDAKKADGSSNYYKDVINSGSSYIWWMNHPDDGANWGSAAEDVAFDTLSANVTATLSGGADGNDVTTGNIINGYSIFENDELYDVSLIPMGPTTDYAAVTSVVSLAENRRDAMVFISPPLSSVVNNLTPKDSIVSYRNAISVNSSFAVIDSGWKYQYDRYNDSYRYVPLNGDIAGLAARTDYISDPWFSPAGYTRGVIKNVVKLAYSPTKADRDELYKIGVNPVVTFPGQGTLLFGDKTLQTRPSAFDRINVRRLFIVLEKAIATASKFQLFEFNDAFTQAQFRNLVEPFLRDVQGRRGITDFRVICDESNNTAEVIDRNEFVADIFIKPARAINFIQLNFIATRSGVSFEEIGA